jgi:NADPH:quinone reductase-like Zn-dependent oxidoreductase
MKVPDDFDLQPAAAAGLAYHTAWHSLIRRAKLRVGEKVLIVGASGGVNTACIQIAKLAGGSVFVVGSSAEKLDRAKALGADFVFNRAQDPNWSKWIYTATAKAGVDLVVDNVGAESMAQSLRAAGKGGRIVTVGNTSGASFEIDNRYIFGKHLSIIGSTMGTQQDFKEVMELVFTGKLESVVDRDFPLADAAAAFQRLEAGEQFGKITLSIP